MLLRDLLVPRFLFSKDFRVEFGVEGVFRCAEGKSVEADLFCKLPKTLVAPLDACKQGLWLHVVDYCWAEETDLILAPLKLGANRQSDAGFVISLY